MSSISNIANEATEQTNTTGVPTSILDIQPEDGTVLVFVNGVQRGDQVQGIPIYADLRDSNDDPLPLDTEISLEFEEPSDNRPSTVSEPRDNVRPYRSLSLKEQQNEEYLDRVKHVLKGPALLVEDVDTLSVVIDSSKQIDWSNSRLQFAEEAVKER